MSTSNTVKKKEMNKLTIYTNETCPYCKQIKEALTKNNIEFEDILTKTDSKEWQSIIDFTGMAIVPTIYFNREYLVPGRDFGNADLLVKLIQNYNPSHYTTEEITLEKIKTFNYNMSVALNKTNQLLMSIEAKLKIDTNEH